jgi:flagellar hook-length control protein FliK
MNPILAALLNAPAPAGASAPSPSAEAGSAAQFKSQFDQAVAALTNTAGPSTPGTSTTTTAAQATTAGSTVQTAALADTLTETLQKKIADLLAKGESVSEIVQQLAAALASSLAAQFGGDPAQIQNQLQTAFVSALSPPSTGPPLSNTDLASALAQRFRLVADVAAGVLGETGQSNRLFAGSISDAATTAGVQPAPQSNISNPTAADSMASDGKTVASNGAPALGPNGDTLLGRILTRAAQSQQAAPGSQTSAALVAPEPSRLSVLALAAAAAALGNGAAAPIATDPSAAAIQHVIANVEIPTAANSGSPATVIATEAPAPLNPAVVAFLKSFSDALVPASAPASAKPVTNGTDPGALLTTTVSSAQSPTIGAFAPVQAVVQNDAASPGGAPTPPLPPSQTTVDPNLVVDQILRGAFLNTVGSVSTVRLRLVPEELGDLSVKLTIDGSSISAQVTAQTPAAHGALVAGQGQLTRALADAGLKLTSFNVDLSGGFASFQQQQQQQSFQQGPSSGRHLLLGGVDATETDESLLMAAPNFGPPILAGTSWSALNYLV